MTVRFCTQCAKQLASDARFCSGCGVPVNPSIAQEAGRKRRANRIAPMMIFVPIGGIILLLVGILIFATRDPSASTVNPQPDSHDEEGIPYPEVARISLKEAKASYETGAAVFVDVRSQAEYEMAHISEAISLPLADLEARYQELSREAEIITYCT